MLCDKILLENRVKIIDKGKEKEKEREKEKGKEEKRVVDTTVTTLKDSTTPPTPHTVPPAPVPVTGRKGPPSPALPLERTEVEVETIPQVM